MRHTLKAVFDQRSDAQHVLDELLAAGYPGTEASISDEVEQDSSLRHTLARLFSRHKADHHRYILTLNADSDPDAQRALGIIESAGPLGVEDAREWRDPWADAGVRPSYPAGTAPGSLQHRPHDDSRYYGIQGAYSAPYGNTFGETMGTISRWDFPEEVTYRVGMEAYGGTSPDIDAEEYFRTHWNARYANEGADSRFEDHLPAYMYGEEARRMEAYRDRHWDEAEADLKAGWEARHEWEGLPWENFKDDVKHGWNRIDLDSDDKQH
jgi:hypothetical protein